MPLSHACFSFLSASSDSLFPSDNRRCDLRYLQTFLHDTPVPGEGALHKACFCTYLFHASSLAGRPYLAINVNVGTADTVIYLIFPHLSWSSL